MARCRLLLTVALLTLGPAVWHANADPRPPALSVPTGWTGLWGPERNGVVDTPRAAPPSRLREIWRRAVGGGYGEVAIDGDTGYALELHGGQDMLVAMALDSGRERWRYALGATYRGHDGSHDGPISTPSLDPSRVFVVGPHGRLAAIDRRHGTLAWEHDLAAEFGAAAPSYGMATAPLLERDLVIVQTGGEKSQGVLAFDRGTGALRWAARHGLRGGYASPVAATLGGRRQIIAAAGDDLFAVDVLDGRLLWRLDGPGSAESVANSPIVLPGNRVLFTFWEEARLVEIAEADGRFQPREVWRSPRLRAAYGPTVHREGSLYGFSGPFLLCLDAATGDVRWRQRVYDGTLVGVGGHLLVLGRTSGLLRIVDAAPDGYHERLRATVFTPGATAMTGPSYANGRVYLRNIDEVAAYALEP